MNQLHTVVCFDPHVDDIEPEDAEATRDRLQSALRGVVEVEYDDADFADDSGGAQLVRMHDDGKRWQTFDTVEVTFHAYIPDDADEEIVSRALNDATLALHTEARS